MQPQHLPTWLLIAHLCRRTLPAVMQAGFAMVEVGTVSAKHTKNMLVKVIFFVDRRIFSVSFLRA